MPKSSGNIVESHCETTLKLGLPHNKDHLPAVSKLIDVE